MKKREPPQSPGLPAWLATYGDMVTLVLTFFVLLFSFSSIDVEKWKSLASALSGTPYAIEDVWPSITNILDQPNASANHQGEQSDNEGGFPLEDADDFERLQQSLREYVADQGYEENLYIAYNGLEITVRFTDNVLFDSGKADVKPESRPILKGIMDQITPYVGAIAMIRIEGHTDNLPINTPRFPNNWWLSTARATTVLEFLLTEYPDISPDMYFAGGYGECKPIANNGTLEGRAMNRRVDVVIVRPGVTGFDRTLQGGGQ